MGSSLQYYYSGEARFGELLFIVCSLFIWSCNAPNSSANKQDTTVFEQPEATASHIPTDCFWRGTPLIVDHNHYKKHKFPDYLAKITQLPNNIAFHYPYGLIETEIPNLLTTIKQKKLARIRYLSQLGISVHKKKALAITYLNLSGRRLVAIPPEIGTLGNLQELLLSYNEIQEINTALRFCTRLKRLDLESNALTQLPSYIHKFKKLKELNLRDNRIGINGLPSSLSQLKNLETLDLSNIHRSMAKGQNKFSHIPPPICYLPNLKRLLLEKLSISQIPISFLNLKRLQILSLSGCYGLNMKSAFRLLSQMPSLQVLDISFTGRTRLPEEIKLLQNLKLLIWQEEGHTNQAEIQRIKALLPNTKIYSGAKGEKRPFLRGNSIKIILNAAN